MFISACPDIDGHEVAVMLLCCRCFPRIHPNDVQQIHMKRFFSAVSDALASAKQADRTTSFLEQIEGQVLMGPNSRQAPSSLRYRS